MRPKLFFIPLLLIGIITVPDKEAGAQTAAQVTCNAGKLKASSITATGANFRYLAQGAQVVEHGVCVGTNSTFTEGYAGFTVYKGVAINLPPSAEYFKAIASGLEPKTKYYAKAFVRNKSGKTVYSTPAIFFITADDAMSQMPDPSDGMKKEYYANGKLMRQYTMRGGALNGVYSMYSDSGFLLTEQNMKDGLPDGFYRTYYKNGHLRGESGFRNGQPDGRMKEYYENGGLKMESNCTGELPKQSCISKSYYDDGTLASETKTSDGEFMSSVHYDMQGRVTSEQTPGNSMSYSYDPDGYKHTSINGEKCRCARCNP